MSTWEQIYRQRAQQRPNKQSSPTEFTDQPTKTKSDQLSETVNKVANATPPYTTKKGEMGVFAS